MSLQKNYLSPAASSTSLNRTFPADIYKQLDGYDFRLIDELAFLCRQQRLRTGAAYCCPGREYLARKVGCDIWTISRHTAKLEKLGLIEKVQRRPVHGQWRSCLYKLKSWCTWRLGQIGAMLRNRGAKKPKESTGVHRVRLDAHIASVRTEIRTPDRTFAQKSATSIGEVIRNSAIYQLWKQRGGGSG